jgi:hypothetical protein
MAPRTNLSAENATSPVLSAVNLKNVLWETLNDIKNDTMLPAQGDAIAAQAREIIRTVKVQLQVVAQAKRNVPTEIIDFVEKSG